MLAQGIRLGAAVRGEDAPRGEGFGFPSNGLGVAGGGHAVVDGSVLFAQAGDLHELYGGRPYFKPGVTGLARVEGCRGEVKDAKDLRGGPRYALLM